jgi:pyruvate/2-oxoglutarate/acetoin dehydrogenase E1 component
MEEGKDITLIGYGNLIRTLVAAASRLRKEGISAEVIDLQTIYPYDALTLINSVKKTGRCIITHEAPKTVGVGA